MSGIPRDLLIQLQHILRPYGLQISNMIAEAEVASVDDSADLQLVQLRVLDGEVIDKAEHYQPYGFKSVPLAGAKAQVLFPGGDRAHALVPVVSDSRYRPKDWEPGDVGLYHHTGAYLKFTAAGGIELHAASGQEVTIDDGSGTLKPIVKSNDVAAIVITCTGGTVSHNLQKTTVLKGK